MTDQPIDRPAATARAAEYPKDWIAAHLATERRASALLGEIREIVFGAQDGLVSTLAVVATVAGASGSSFDVVVAGIATALAGLFSMAAGEYIGSKSQREIFEAQIENERAEVRDRPGESEAEVAYMLTEEGMDEASAAEVAARIARHPEVLLRTMVSKELGIQVGDQAGSPIQGAVLMGAAFGLGAAVPVVPFVLVQGGPALLISGALTGMVLFAIGVIKSRWTRRSALRSGLEILAVATVAGVAGYLFGTVLPSLLGVAGLAA
jgi:VIT1/CCC1 family predicted Fe2+/Mn2+ transporter